MITEDSLRSDLGKFVDLDSEVVVTAEQSDLLATFTQNGEMVVLRAAADGSRVREKRGEQTLAYNTYQGLLASPGFGNLKRLAAAQAALILREAPYLRDVQSHLPIVGELEGSGSAVGAGDLLSKVDHWLTSQSHLANEIRALVIDGPAGIGKTHLIRRLSLDRARGFGPGSAPPLLHVQSRGRKLTGLNDALAGTLDALRLSLTFDQLPLLVKHGLLQIAVDGFDELADPEGYKGSWGLMADFCQSIRGQGAIVLAGRDTFIDVEVVWNALSILNQQNTSAAHLRPLSRHEAMHWLAVGGMGQARVKALDDARLFEDGSYALRPFFIAELQRYAETGEEIFDSFVDFPLKALVDRIISREIGVQRFNDLLGEENAKKLLVGFLEEVARTMADSESERVDVASLQLIAEMVFGEHLNEEELAVIRHRVGTIALLEQDIAPDERKFPHTEIQDYFLALSFITLVHRDEPSRALSRNILGTDFLDTFSDIAGVIDPDRYVGFFQQAIRRCRTVSSHSREAKNVTAMILASAERFTELGEPVKFTGIALDEVCLRGDLPFCTLESGTISLLDARGCDFSRVTFIDITVSTLIADDTTRLPVAFAPARLQLARGGKVASIFDPEELAEWLADHRALDLAPVMVSEAQALLRKLSHAILRQKWIRQVENDRSGKLLFNPEWPEVKRVLAEEGLLQMRGTIAASGPKSDFFSMDLVDASAFLSSQVSDKHAKVWDRLA